MKNSPPLKVNKSSGSQEIPSIFWNPEVHYGNLNSLLPVPTLRQNNPVLAPNPLEDPF